MDQANIIEISDEQESDDPQQDVPQETENNSVEAEEVNRPEELESEIPDIEEIEDSTPVNKNVSLTLSFENVNKELVEVLQCFINTNFEKYEKKKKEGVTASVTYYPDFCIDTIPKEEEEFVTHQAFYDVFSKINDTDTDTSNKTIARKRKRDVSCWNCGSKDHQVYDCPFDKDESIIEKNRKSFVESKEMKKATPQKQLRYYEEEIKSEKGFEDLLGGVIVTELKNALKITEDKEVPYNKRFEMIGIPPAYIKRNNENDIIVSDDDENENNSKNNNKNTIILVEDEEDHEKVDLLDKQIQEEEEEEEEEENEENEENNSKNNNNHIFHYENNKVTKNIHHFPRCTCNKDITVYYPFFQQNVCLKHNPPLLSTFETPSLITLKSYSNMRNNNNNNNNNSHYRERRNYPYNNSNSNYYNNRQIQQQQQQQSTSPYYYNPQNYYNNEMYSNYNNQPPLPTHQQPPLPPNYYYQPPPPPQYGSYNYNAAYGTQYGNYESSYRDDYYNKYNNNDNSSHSHSHTRHSHSHSKHSHSHSHHHYDSEDDRYPKKMRKGDY